VARLERGATAQRFREAFGADVFTDSERAFNALVLALEVFQQSPQDFYPYSSRYDAWLRGRGELTKEELHGLSLFNDPSKGNCASCHPSQGRAGALPQFTDFGFVALGVPRNRQIAANANPGYYDLGLCGPQRTDYLNRPEYCGLFRAPSLRNVATRRTFFHNGVIHSLDKVVKFYVERDRKPEKWYTAPRRDRGLPYDDLPMRYRENVNTEPPFGSISKPALSRSEIKAVVAFLGTLTDADATPVRPGGAAIGSAQRDPRQSR